MTTWREDVLGAGFACTDLDLGTDAEGPVVATLVRSLPEPGGWFDRLRRRSRPLAGVDVLYVHGWSDYFFQRDLAAFWTERGARFFALDLRKYGRSLRPGQTPGYIEDLAEYDREIDLAMGEIRDSASAPVNARRLILMGHSTGGLVLSLFLSRRPGAADALILNSPWLEFQLARAGRQLLAPILDLTARLQPRDYAPQLDFGFYSRAQHAVAGAAGFDPVNQDWRPERAHGVRAGWMRAILAGHAQVEKGLGLQGPVQVLLSARSAAPTRWSDELTRADSVLDVERVAGAALKLGRTVTVDRIDGALHDVFLSAELSRRDAFYRLERWLTGWQAGLALVEPAAAEQLASPAPALPVSPLEVS